MLNDIKIAGYNVKIIEDKNLIPNEMNLGEYLPFEQKIKLAKGLTRQQKNETLIHEVLEAINDIYELSLEHDEQLCTLSVVIHQIIVDNKQLIVKSFCRCRFLGCGFASGQCFPGFPDFWSGSAFFRHK